MQIQKKNILFIPKQKTKKQMDAAHADVITDVAYNWYGSRLAVASADHSVSIWQNSGGTWTLHKRFVAHSAPVRSAAWAAPELGELLATAGDRTVKIWQKDPSKELFRITLNAAAIQVKWAPPAFALKIAAVDASGAITIAECLDPHSQVWDIVTLNSIDHSLRIALDWAGEAHMFVVACDLYAKIYFFDNKWKVKETIQHSSVLTCVAWAPSMGRSFHLIATAALDGHVRIFKLKPDIVSS